MLWMAVTADRFEAASLLGRISHSLGKKITYYGINDTEQEIEAEQWKDMRI